MAQAFGTVGIALAGSARITKQVTKGTVGFAVSGNIVASQVVKGTVGLAIAGAVIASQKVAGTVGIAISGAVKISQKVTGSVGIAISGAVKITKQFANGTVGLAILGSIIRPFNGLLGHVSGVLKSHLLGDLVKKHSPSGSVKNDQAAGEEA